MASPSEKLSHYEGKDLQSQRMLCEGGMPAGRKGLKGRGRWELQLEEATHHVPLMHHVALMHHVQHVMLVQHA